MAKKTATIMLPKFVTNLGLFERGTGRAVGRTGDFKVANDAEEEGTGLSGGFAHEGRPNTAEDSVDNSG